MVQKIGFVGLGVMGGGMCRRILQSKDYDLTVFDLDSTKVEELVALGANPAISVEQIFGENDIICASLPNPAIIKKVFLQPALFGLAKGKTILDLSTVDSDTSKEVAAAYAQHDAVYVDTPVSGGKTDTVKGTLTLIIGARADELQHCLPLLKLIGHSVHFAGARGAGSTIKLVNNLISLGTLMVTAEGFVLGAKAGVDGGTLFNILQHCGSKSTRMMKVIPNVLKGNFEPGFAVDLAEKDLTLALELAGSLKLPLLMASLCRDLFLTTSKTGRGALDAGAVVQYLEQLNNVEVRGEAVVEANI